MFKKALAEYYRQWYSDCLNSIEFCKSHGDNKRAQQYSENAAEYKKIIDENTEAIDFFSKDGNAFKREEALPERFRGYD